MGLENHDFSRRKKQSHRRRGNLNSTLRISCHDVALLKGFGIKNKLKPRIRSVCYWLKYCIVGEKCKHYLSGSTVRYSVIASMEAYFSEISFSNLSIKPDLSFGSMKTFTLTLPFSTRVLMSAPANMKQLSSMK